MEEGRADKSPPTGCVLVHVTPRWGYLTFKCQTVTETKTTTATTRIKVDQKTTTKKNLQDEGNSSVNYTVILSTHE